MGKKYAGYNEDDTFWDDYHRKNGMMTNREFFSSNAKGGFYEGMEWDGEKWVPNAEERAKERQREEAYQCSNCGAHKAFCECDY